MSKNYQYFTIPFDLVSNLLPTPHTLWYATWSTRPPVVEPGMPLPLVIGVTEDEPPPGAVVLGVGSKDPPPPPPLDSDTNDYQSTISQWLAVTRSADE